MRILVRATAVVVASNLAVAAVPDPWRNAPAVRTAAPAELRELPRELVIDRRPAALERAAYAAFLDLAREAERAGVRLRIVSAFRSEAVQARILAEKRASGISPDVVARSIAPAGRSTHASGRAVDFAPADPGFASTPAYAWLRENAARFGFRETYARGNALGAEWEPWHYDFAVTSR